MMIPFATTCDAEKENGDICNARSDEYTAWPHCRECGEDICPGCAEDGTLQENDGRNTVLCRPCAAERE